MDIKQVGVNVTALYRGMNRAQLEIAYAPSSMIGGNYQPYIQRYSADSERARRQFEVLLDQPYASHPDQTYDLYLTAASIEPTTTPVHLFIHGGYWQALSSKESAMMALSLLPRGVNLAVLNYTLAPHAGLTQMVGECAQCIRVLQDRFQSKLSLSASGHSAGAHLLMQMLHQHSDIASSLELAVAISGIYDLEPICSTSINVPLGLTLDNVKALSPLMGDAVIETDVLVAVAALDTDEFKRQSRDYAAMLDNAELVEIANTHHFDIVLEFEGASSVLRDRIVSCHQT